MEMVWYNSMLANEWAVLAGNVVWPNCISFKIHEKFKEGKKKVIEVAFIIPLNCFQYVMTNILVNYHHQLVHVDPLTHIRIK